VKLRLLPQSEDTYFDLFEAATNNLCRAATVLLEMLGDLTDLETKATYLRDLEYEGDRITHDILTRLATTFVARLDRDDIYALAIGLNGVTDTIQEVGDQLLLHRISQPLPAVTEQAQVLVWAADRTAAGMGSLHQADRARLADYLIAIDELERQGDQLYRRVRAGLYDFTGDHPARHVLQWKDITDGVEDALDELAHIAHSVQGILLKHT
jgi:uncharacterized protein